jgi:preprotein translocase subunit SecD
VELYFRRPAKVIPIHNQEEEFEIVQEVPWLTEEDIAWISPRQEGEHPYLRLYLTPEGRQKYREAMMGNIGRTMVFTLDGTVRYTARMEPVRQKNRIDLSADFSPEEVERINEQIKNRPVPTPTSAPTPTPPRKKRFIIR